MEIPLARDEEANPSMGMSSLSIVYRWVHASSGLAIACYSDVLCLCAASGKFEDELTSLLKHTGAGIVSMVRDSVVWVYRIEKWLTVY